MQPLLIIRIFKLSNYLIVEFSNCRIIELSPGWTAFVMPPKNPGRAAFVMPSTNRITTLDKNEFHSQPLLNRSASWRAA